MFEKNTKQETTEIVAIVSGGVELPKHRWELNLNTSVCEGEWPKPVLLICNGRRRTLATIRTKFYIRGIVNLDTGDGHYFLASSGPLPPTMERSSMSPSGWSHRDIAHNVLYRHWTHAVITGSVL
ncbi:hypothetical protein AAG570_005993 [Ranatra chinensis]|uniref:Uncharacterized protein n=1 Tax=Ranatra chinensis TaxID=642074 RepID=A0ABD0XX23_9HEMI